MVGSLISSSCLIFQAAGAATSSSKGQRAAFGAGASVLGMATGSAASQGENDLTSLLVDVTAFNVACKPREFDFRAHMPACNKEKESSTGKDQHDKQLKRLPHRLLLSAFSKTVGHRSTGLQTAQVRVFVQRFPSEFREMSMQKVVLPCSMDGSLPFVTTGGSCLAQLSARSTL